MQLTLVGTQLRIGGGPAPGSAPHGADDSLGPPLSISTLAAYLLSQPDLRASWRVSLCFGLAGLDLVRWDDAFVEEVLDTKPEVLGLSSFCWDLDAHLDLARRVKELCPDTLVVLGGPSVNGQAEALLRRCPAVDVAINGEGETRLAALLRGGRAALSSLSQTAWRDSAGQVRSNDGLVSHLDFSEIPSPYPGGIVRPALSQAPYVETSRGCVNRCRFCAWNQRSGGVRHAPYERLREEVRWAREGGYRRLFRKCSPRPVW